LRESNPTAPPDPIVSVCVCTFRRPALLGALLDALAAQRHAPRFEVVVVDNDAGASAARVIAAARAQYPAMDLRDHAEPEQNIALARNRAVAEARGRFVAFIDDDEQPVATWLGALAGTAARTGADGVFGPVLARLAPGVPEWIARGHFFDRPRHLTGTPVPDDELRTGNAFLRRSLLQHTPAPPSVFSRAADDEGPAGERAAGPEPRADREPIRGPFDPRYGLSGGEDSVLLGRLAESGARFVWCDEAVVHERVPVERARLRWLLERSFGAGCGHARLRIERVGPAAVPSLLLRGGGALALGALLAPLSLPLDLARAVRLARIGAAGAGKLAGVAGHHVEPYRQGSG
jgi:succinoglycan biosynthesis protein ExoM